jgi:hypothetical protein
MAGIAPGHFALIRAASASSAVAQCPAVGAAG